MSGLTGDSTKLTAHDMLLISQVCRARFLPPRVLAEDPISGGLFTRGAGSVVADRLEGMEAQNMYGTDGAPVAFEGPQQGGRRGR
jgi:hypothetical protein